MKKSKNLDSFQEGPTKWSFKALHQVSLIFQKKISRCPKQRRIKLLARLKNATCNLIKSFKDEANTSLITKISLNFFLKFWLKLFNPQNYKILIFKVILQFQNLSGSFYSLLFENINLGANFCKKKTPRFLVTSFLKIFYS